MGATIAGIHLGPDIHANRPAANAAGQPIGALYSCTTHGKIYKTDGSSWSDYATLGSSPSGSITASGYTQATARILGRTTGSSGAIEEISVGTGLSLAAGVLSATGGAAPTFVGWDIYNSGNVSLSNGSETSITFNSERTSGDSSSFHDTGSNTHLVTIPSGKDGWYLVGAMSDLTSSAGAGSYIAIIKNGTSYIATGSIVNVAGYTGGHVERLIKLVATDTLQVKILANAGSKNALAAADYSPEFWGVLVGV